MSNDKVAVNWQQLISSPVVADTTSNFFAEIVQETFALTRRLFIQL
jgi:ABC-2 type transport system permease protein